MKKTILIMIAIFLGVFVLFVASVHKSAMDIGTIAFLYSMASYLLLYFSINIKGKNSRLVNMRGFGMSNSFNYNSELVVSDIVKLENEVGGVKGASNLDMWFIFAIGTFYFAVCIVCGFIA